MMERVEARALAAAEAAAERARARVAVALAEVPGVSAEVVEGGVLVRGRRLAARWVADARLRWIGGGL
jgi:hypothetical protein